MRHAGIAAIAFAALTGLAMPASAVTFGSISNGAGFNDGVVPIYGTSSRNGYFDANLYISGPATLKIDYLGAEAGNQNKFFWGSELSALFTTPGNGTWTGSALSTTRSVAAGLLSFFFKTPGGAVDANGTNSRPATNFFVSFDGGDGSATSGTSVVLWYDDGGSVDDNHDDMAIRLSVVGPSTLSEVPVPAAGLLMLGGLGALAGLRRRRKS